MELRELKALELAARARITFDGGAWLVPAQAVAGTTCRVTTGERPSRQCEDWQLRQPQPCKHLLAVRLVIERDHGGTAPALDTSEVPKKKSSRQIWPLDNLAQATEKHRFQILLRDLCRGVPESPKTKPGRVPRTVRDSIFAAVFKIYPAVSSRRFIESVFSAAKAKCRDHARSKTDTAMKNEVLCKLLAHDLCAVHQSHVELGIEPVFWADQSPADLPATIPFPRLSSGG